MKSSERLLLVLALGGFVACARGGGDIDSIDPFLDGPIDGVTVPDSGLSGDASISDGSVGDAAGPQGDALPIGAISFFDRACPVGWTPYAGAVGRTIVPTNGGATLVSIGDPYTSGESRTHSHGVSLSFDLAKKGIFASLPGTMTGAGTYGTVTANTTSAASSATIPYVQMMVCKKTAAPIAGTIPTGLSAYFEAATCPTSWIQVSNSKGRILVASPAGGSTGSTFGSATPLADGEMRTHAHPVTGSWTPTSYGIAGFEGSGEECGRDQAYPYPDNTLSSDADTTPPYLALTHCRKN